MNTFSRRNPPSQFIKQSLGLDQKCKSILEKLTNSLSLESFYSTKSNTLYAGMTMQVAKPEHCNANGGLGWLQSNVGLDLNDLSDFHGTTLSAEVNNGQFCATVTC